MAGTVFKTARRVEFRDTDAAGIAHFSVFFSWMEAAEHELLRSEGLSVIGRDGGRTISWPRVAARCEYRQAVRFEDELSIDVAVSRLGNRSVTYEFRFFQGEAAIADGSLTAVCCEIPPGDLHAAGRPLPIDIPAGFRQRLERYVIPAAT
jgi:4-hydroxybenzoyl-CoA thioesterase/acyl-CoA thioester hydrolase